MSTCKTCRFWEKAGGPGTSENWRADRVCVPTDPDTYEPMPMPFEVRVCTLAGQHKTERPTEANGCGVVDASDYWAALVTGEDFGCVRHEERPA